MIAIISPSKTFSTQAPLVEPTGNLRFPDETGMLIRTLKSLSAAELAALMKTSEKLTDHTLKLIRELEPDRLTSSHRSAIYNFTGGVYQGLVADDFTHDDLSFAQTHLRILSGLYGVLSPLDAIQPYRLMMGTSLKTSRGKTLYSFWGDAITHALNEDTVLSNSTYLVNLASDEYYKCINSGLLRPTVIHTEFYIEKGGIKKFISFDAKKARGLMARYIVKNKINNPEDLAHFDYDGYKLLPDDSSRCNLVFAKKG